MNKLVKENIGAGFSMGLGSNTGVTSGNAGGILGQLKPYDYKILPVTNALEQKPNEYIVDKPNLNVGMQIQGKVYNDLSTNTGNNIIKGVITNINRDGDIITNVQILSHEDSKKYNILPDSIEILSDEEFDSDNFRSMNNESLHLKAKKVADFM